MPLAQKRSCLSNASLISVSRRTQDFSQRGDEHRRFRLTIDADTENQDRRLGMPGKRSSIRED